MINRCGHFGVGIIVQAKLTPWRSLNLDAVLKTLLAIAAMEQQLAHSVT
jgi:hypothetical protein